MRKEKKERELCGRCVCIFFLKEIKKEKRTKENILYFFSLQNKRQDVDMTPIIYR